MAARSAASVVSILGPSPAGAVGLVVLLVAAATAPFPLGGVQPGGTLRIQLLAFLALSAALLEERPPGRQRIPRLALLAAALVAALAVLGAVQLLPLPAGVLKAVSPASAAVYSGAQGVLSLFRHASPAPRVSIAPYETSGVVLLALAYAAMFLAAVQLVRTRLRRRLFGATLLGSMALQVLTAVGAERQEARISGPYFNPDHFAGYLEIGLPFAFVLAWQVAARVVRAFRRTHSVEGLERRLAAVAFAVILWAVLASGIALTQSRGGILAAFAATLFVGGLSAAFPARRHQTGMREKAAGAAAAVAGFLFAAAALGGRPLLRFLATDPRDLGADTRVQVWGLSLDVWKRFPVFGSGLGTFREAIRMVQPRELGGLLEQAHSDPMQLLVTGGLAGFLLGAGAVVSLFVLLSRGWQGQQHREERAFALAGLGALVSLALHGLAEFNFSLPATPATLAAVLGASVAAALWRESDEPVVLSAASTVGCAPARSRTANVTRP